MTMGATRSGFQALVLALAFAGVAAQNLFRYDGSGCPNKCGRVDDIPRGFCRGIDLVCECIDQWSGRAHDCSERRCPVDVSWFDQPISSTQAHTTQSECSGRGYCNTKSGLCSCMADMEGEACQRSKCPGTGENGPCNGHGVCTSTRNAGLRQKPDPLDYTDWDGDRIYGCLCDEGWGGADCSQVACPVGTDPLVRGNTDVFEIRTQAPTRHEVQSIVIDGTCSGGGGSGGCDEDEVQTLTLGGDTDLPYGSFTLNFDSSPSSGKCRICEFQLLPPSAATVSITPLDEIATAAAVQAALESLPNIGVGGVVVSGTMTATDFVFDITFSGLGVGGDVPLLTLSTTGLAFPAGVVLATASIVETRRGSEVSGLLSLSYDDSLQYPSAADFSAGSCVDTEDGNALNLAGVFSLTTNAVGTTTTVRNSITDLVFGCNTLCIERAPVGALAVSRHMTGGPGVEWRVTFQAGARARGDVAPLVYDSSASTMQINLDGSNSGVTVTSVEATITETVKGAFMQGEWYMKLSLADVTGATRDSPLYGPLPWCMDPAHLSTTLTAFDPQSSIGAIHISRTRNLPGGVAGDWTGGYIWRVTFDSLAEDVPDPFTDGSGMLVNDPLLVADFTAVEVRKGDATAAVNEVEVINCACDGAECTDPAAQYVRLSYDGHTTDPIPYSATAAQVRAALAALPNLYDVIVNMYDVNGGSASSLCDADGVSTAVTFAWNPIMKDTLKVFPNRVDPKGITSQTYYALPDNALFSISPPGVFGLYGGRGKRGTRTVIPCSGRGICLGSGECQCYAGYGMSDNGGGGDVVAGNGAASPPEALHNCGRVLTPATACPTNYLTSICTNHGTCSGAPDFKCTCFAGWTGAACETKTCSMGTAWFGVPQLVSGVVTPHVPALCGNRGVCAGGSCTCMLNHVGDVCQYLGCPGNLASPTLALIPTKSRCLKGQPCVSLRQMGRSYTYTENTYDPIGDSGIDYNNWDADMVRGCACDKVDYMYVGRSSFSWQSTAGFNCEEITCPVGEDPQVVPRAPVRTRQTEIQHILCTLTAGKVRFTFRGQTTKWIPWDAPVLDSETSVEWIATRFVNFETPLRALNTTKRSVVVEVDGPSASGARRLCTASGNTRVLLHFPAFDGDVPMLTVEMDAAAAADAVANGGSITITEAAAGTSQSYECSRRGVCDRTTGMCKCQPQFGNSDGESNSGEIGNCGYRNVELGRLRTLPGKQPTPTPRIVV